MKQLLRLGIIGIAVATLTACGGAESDELDGGAMPDARVASDVSVASDGGTDTLKTDASPAAIKYTWVVIQDKEGSLPASQRASCGNGPGSDIDAVALIRDTIPIGYGKIGSGQYAPSSAGPTCSEAECTAGVCKYAGTTLVMQAEGLRNAKVFESTSDVGYVSLNGGILYLRIGDISGGGSTFQEIKPNDQIKVFEVDQTYKTSGDAFAGCACSAEHYEVWIQDDSQTPVSKQLVPAKFEADNKDCGQAGASGVMQGCGTTVFGVPAN